jgi:hypothetical protein
VERHTEIRYPASDQPVEIQLAAHLVRVFVKTFANAQRCAAVVDSRHGGTSWVGRHDERWAAAAWRINGTVNGRPARAGM